MKEAGRDFSYLIVVFFGVSITGHKAKQVPGYLSPATHPMAVLHLSLCFFRWLVIYGFQRTVFFIQS